MITYENGVFALQGEGFTCLLRVNQWNLLEQLYFGPAVMASDWEAFACQPGIGWSSGVLAFIIEHIVGLQVGAGYREVSVKPHSLGLTDVDASFPTPYGTLSIHTHNGKTEVDVPEGIILR